MGAVVGQRALASSSHIEDDQLAVQETATSNLYGPAQVCSRESELLPIGRERTGHLAGVVSLVGEPVQIRAVGVDRPERRWDAAAGQLSAAGEDDRLPSGDQTGWPASGVFVRRRAPEPSALIA